MNEYKELILLAEDLPHELINLPRPRPSVFWYGDFVKFGDYIGCILVPLSYDENIGVIVPDGDIEL